MSAELAFNRSQDVDYGVAQEVAPGIRRIVANNPGPYTFLGTNSYVVGSGEVAVIDPGPADERLVRLLESCWYGVLLSCLNGRLSPAEADVDIRVSCEMLLGGRLGGTTD